MTVRTPAARIISVRTALAIFSLTAMLLLGGCGDRGDAPASDPSVPDTAASETPGSDTSPSDPPAEADTTPATPSVPSEDAEPVGEPPATPDRTGENAPATETADQGAIAFDTTLIPGEQVGPLTRDTSRQELAEQVGEARLVDTEVHVGEGFMEPGTEVDLGNGYSFSVIWADAGRTTPREVRDLSAQWQTPEGIGMGTSFEKLQTILGPFELYGFAWDYGGTILLEDTQLSEYDGLLTLRVTPSTSTMQTASTDYQQVIGDQVYSSTNPHLQPLDIEVYDMIVTLSAAE